MKIFLPSQWIRNTLLDNEWLARTSFDMGISMWQCKVFYLGPLCSSPLLKQHNFFIVLQNYFWITLISCWSHAPKVPWLHLTLVGLAENVMAGVTQGSVTQNTVQREHTPAVKRLNSYGTVPWWESKKAVLQSIWYPWHLTWTCLFNFRNLGLSHQGAVGDKDFETFQRSTEKMRKEKNFTCLLLLSYKTWGK